MLTIKRKLLTNEKVRPALRKPGTGMLRQVRAIVAHWTANEGRGADAEAHVRYFNQALRPASCHYIVDSNETIQCVPDMEVAFHVGDNWRHPGARQLAGTQLKVSANLFCIGFEMCVNKDGDWNKTYWHSVELAAFLLLKHGLTVQHLLRHMDISGKLCPRMFLANDPWNKFRLHVGQTMAELRTHLLCRAVVNNPTLNIRADASAQSADLGDLVQGEPVLVWEERGNWARIENGAWVHKSFIQKA